MHAEGSEVCVSVNRLMVAELCDLHEHRPVLQSLGIIAISQPWLPTFGAVLQYQPDG